jgi:hypothetical protein
MQPLSPKLFQQFLKIVPLFRFINSFIPQRRMQIFHQPLRLQGSHSSLRHILRLGKLDLFIAHCAKMVAYVSLHHRNQSINREGAYMYLQTP